MATYFQDTGEGLLQPRAHSQVVMARTPGTFGSQLQEKHEFTRQNSRHWGKRKEVLTARLAAAAYVAHVKRKRYIGMKERELAAREGGGRRRGEGELVVGKFNNRSRGDPLVGNCR